MKFLCIACDEPMKLMETRGPDRGSMAVLFGCPACGHEIAMLTNAMETQMVRSLGVKVGGRKTAAKPMEMLQDSLSTTVTVEAAEVEVETSEAPESSSKCPFTGMVEEAHAEPETVEPPVEEVSGSKCPFTGTVEEAVQKQAEVRADPVWTSEAEARIERIPVFVRPMVKKGVEQHARDRGYAEITEAVMDEVRGVFGM